MVVGEEGEGEAYEMGAGVGNKREIQQIQDHLPQSDREMGIDYLCHCIAHEYFDRIHG